MANTSLIALINAYIKRNGNQEITGPVLNGVLLAIAEALGTPYIGLDGKWFIYDAETGEFIDSGIDATGPQGERGERGETGPTGPAGVTEAYATILPGTVPAVATTLFNGRLDFTFSGIEGQPGQPGLPGPQGVSVLSIDQVSSSSQSGGTNVIRVTLDNGQTFDFEVKNGQQGNPGAAAGFGTPTASVDANVGTPSVQVTASGPDTAKVFNFAFHNLKGAQGNPGTPGAAAGFGTPTASVDANTGTPSVQVTSSGPDTAKVFNFAFHNLKGAQGNPGTPGAAAGFGTPTASVDANVGTPSVTVTPSGPDTAKVFDFAFHNIKGAQGIQGDPGDSCAVPVATAIPSGGLAANKHYALGTITGAVTIDLDTTTEVAGQMNIYSLAFRAGSPAPTITWPAEIMRWAGNCLDSQTLAPVITAGNSYEVSIVDGLAVITEFAS